MSAPIVLQSEQSECGLACLAMIAGHYRAGHSLVALRSRFNVGAAGANLAQLLNIAREIELVGRGLRLEPEQAQALRLPAILHWELNHFVVLVAVRRRCWVIHDPARGRYSVRPEEIDQRFTGVALELWPGERFKPVPTRATGLRLSMLWRLVKTEVPVTGMVVLSLLMQVLLLVGPWHVQWAVDEAVLRGDVHLVGVLAAGFGLVLLFRAAVMAVRGLLLARLGHGLAFAFASRLLEHLFRLPYTWFSRHNTGDVAARFTSLMPVKDFFTQGAAALLVDGLVVMLSAVAMLIYSPKLALVVMAAQLLFVLVYALNLAALRALTMGAVVAQGAEHAHLIESLRGIHSLKVYGVEADRWRGWQQLHSRALTQSYALQVRQSALAVLATVLGGAELIGVVTLGAYAVLEGGTFSLGMLFAFLSYRALFSERLKVWVEQWAQIRTLRAHLDRLGDIWLSEALLPAEHAAAIKPDEGTAVGFSMTNVSFAYHTADEDILQQINLDIAPGEYVAIVGPSGSGKTTLLRLLMGLLSADRGRLCVGGQVLHAANAATLRRQWGCVLQEDTLFSGSVLSNIALGQTPQPDRAWQVLAEVGMQAEIQALPMGLQTVLGDIDSLFSSGQCQRLLLARALYRAPRALFLDEGTANLDRHSAERIFAVLDRLACTRIVVTHDSVLAARAARCIRLQEGRLAAQT